MAVVMWFIICIPFFISREAPFLIQALIYLPSQFIAIAVPAFVLYRAGLRTVLEQNRIVEASAAPEMIADK
jgi:uncharacterized membrane protein